MLIDNETQLRRLAEGWLLLKDIHLDSGVDNIVSNLFSKWKHCVRDFSNISVRTTYYIMKLCTVIKNLQMLKWKFTLLKNVYFKLVETSRARIHWRPSQSVCFFPRFSLVFVSTVSDTALTERPLIKSIFQNDARKSRNQSFNFFFSFLLFFTNLSYWLYLLCLPSKFFNKCQKTSTVALFYVVFGQLLSKATLLFVYKNHFSLSVRETRDVGRNFKLKSFS